MMNSCASFSPSVFDRALDQVRAVVGGDDFHAFGQAALELGQAFLDPLDGGQRVAAEAHHDDAADRFALAVEFADAAPEVRAVAHFGDMAHQYRHAFVGGLERDALQVVERIDVAGGADHVLGLGHLDHPAAGFHVAALDGTANGGQRNAVGAQPVRVHHHLVLAHHAADGRDLGNPFDGLQLEFQKPVLQRPEIGQAVIAAAVDQGVLVDPADAGRIRPQRGPRAVGQLGRHLAQVFQHP